MLNIRLIDEHSIKRTRYKLSRRMVMLHIPTLQGNGKWENKMTYIKYKRKRKIRNRMANFNRKINR